MDALPVSCYNPAPFLPSEVPSIHTATRPASRRGYIDWLRGLAILVMIETHVLDSWTRGADRNTLTFGYAKVLGGFAAPLFLFLAGLAVVLAVRSQVARTGDVRSAARAVQRRGWQIFGLAFLFRFQAYALNPSALPVQMLRVDILNIMGPGIAFAAMMCAVAQGRRARLLLFGVAAAAMTFLTPVVFDIAPIRWLPDPVEAYIHPIPGHDGFTFFPWIGFVFAGGLFGALLDRSRTRAQEVRLHAGLAAAGVAGAFASYYAWYLPSPYAHTWFWSTSPAFFFMRASILVSALGLVYFQHLAPAPLDAIWRPMRRFGRSSLLVYWVHVELVYGIASKRLQHHLPVGGAIAGFVLVTLAMFAMVVIKDALADQWRERRRAVAVAAVD